MGIMNMNIHCKCNDNLSEQRLQWNVQLIMPENTTVLPNSALRTFSVRANLVLKLKNVLILSVIYYINHQLVIGDLVLKVKFDCI